MYAKIHYSPPKGGAFAPPLPPLNPPLTVVVFLSKQVWTTMLRSNSEPTATGSVLSNCEVTVAVFLSKQQCSDPTWLQKVFLAIVKSL